MNIVCVYSICSIIYKIDLGCVLLYIQINNMSAAMNCNYCKTLVCEDELSSSGEEEDV